ncbi:bifunctional metallophosphatase/5'-nucleotidase [Microbaculum sp. FT89]|uniref:bifunctional metallophosphatase/5'-nucleotidase n=1 Tax=Microbaculum sp. FT89 TaxID=3447298 RepID=UPI003F531C14
MLKRWLSRFVLVALAFALGMTAARTDAAAEPVNVTFVLVNDLDSIEVGATRGGFARLATLVARERAANENTLVLHAGDAIFPSLLSGFDQGTHVVELLNMIAPDAMTPGNHEFDLGPDVFRELVEQATFPVLAANMREADGTRVRGVRDTRMFEFGGAKVGLIGLTSEDAYEKSNPGDLTFGKMSQALEEQAARLREAGADIIVALAHASRPEDQALIGTRAADVILSGDDHDLTVFFDGRTVLAESKAQAEYIVLVDLTIDIGEEDGQRSVQWTPGFRVVDTARIAPDPAIAARIRGYEAELSKELDVGLGTVDVALDSRRATVRTQETAIGNLIADAMRSATRADAAITNGGGIRGDKIYQTGAELTRRDILTELPFRNKTVIIELTGAQIKEALENGYSAIDQVSGRFAHVSGMRVTADLSKPVGERVTGVEIGNAPLDPAKTYKIATNDFLLRGGDGYTVFGEGKVIRGALHGNLMASDVMVYVRIRGTKGAAVDGRVSLQ